MREFKVDLIVRGLRHTISTINLSHIAKSIDLRGKKRQPTELQLFEERFKHYVRLSSDIHSLVESFDDPQLKKRFDDAVKARRQLLASNLADCCRKEAEAEKLKDKPYWLFDENGLWTDRHQPMPPADAVCDESSLEVV